MRAQAKSGLSLGARGHARPFPSPAAPSRERTFAARGKRGAAGHTPTFDALSQMRRSDTVVFSWEWPSESSPRDAGLPDRRSMADTLVHCSACPSASPAPDPHLC